MNSNEIGAFAGELLGNLLRKRKILDAPKKGSIDKRKIRKIIKEIKKKKMKEIKKAIIIEKMDRYVIRK